MLKKITSILLIPILLICSAGGIVYVERCGMNKGALYSFTSEQSCCCSKESHKKCCSNKKVLIQKIQDNFSASAYAIVDAGANSFLSSLPDPGACISCRITPLFVYTRDHPPPDIFSSLPILHRSLRI